MGIREPVQTIRRRYRVLRFNNLKEIFTTTFPISYFLQLINVIFYGSLLPSAWTLHNIYYGEKGIGFPSSSGCGCYSKTKSTSRYRKGWLSKSRELLGTQGSQKTISVQSKAERLSWSQQSTSRKMDPERVAKEMRRAQVKRERAIVCHIKFCHFFLTRRKKSILVRQGMQWTSNSDFSTQCRSMIKTYVPSLINEN